VIEVVVRLKPRGKSPGYPFRRRLCGLQLFTKIIKFKRTNTTLHQDSNIPVSVEKYKVQKSS
jgi:hypothetical protein